MPDSRPSLVPIYRSNVLRKRDLVQRLSGSFWREWTNLLSSETAAKFESVQGVMSLHIELGR